MKYRHAWQFLQNLREQTLPRAEPFQHLLSIFDDPHENVDTMRIVGSCNTKHTARMTSRLLQENGNQVGLFSTSHTDGVRERIRIDGAKISKTRICQFVEQIREQALDLAIAGDAPTFDQAMLVLAFWEFNNQDVDFGVLEVDSHAAFTTTNVAPPSTTAISDLAASDELLSEAVQKYCSATNDGGVSPSIVASQTTIEQHNLPIEAAKPTTIVGLSDSELSSDIEVEYNGRSGTTGTANVTEGERNVSVSLKEFGDQGAINAGIAVGAALSETTLHSHEIDRGLRTAHSSGRFEVMSQSPLVILDSADDIKGARRILEWLEEFDYDQRYLVIGGERDTDYRGIAGVFSGPRLNTAVACQPDGKRPEPVTVIEHAFNQQTNADVATRNDGGEGAVNEALAEVDPDDAVVVTGSSAVVREARKRWSRQFVQKNITDISDSKKVLQNAHVTRPGVWRIKGKAVHRAVKTRLRGRAARHLKIEMLSLGGECAISGLDNEQGEYFDVLLIGTLAQYNRLIDKLEGQPYGLSPFAEQLRQALEIRTPDSCSVDMWDSSPGVIGILKIGHQAADNEDGMTDSIQEKAREMIETGVDILDVEFGPDGLKDEATAQVEREQVTAVINTLGRLEASICVSTRSPLIADTALAAGADIVYNRSTVTDPQLLAVTAEYDAPVILQPSDPIVATGTIADGPDDVVEEIITSLTDTIVQAESVGIPKSRIILDPAVNRLPTVSDRLEVITRLDEFHTFGETVLFNRPGDTLADEMPVHENESLGRAIPAIVAAERGADLIRVREPESVIPALSIGSLFGEM
jgi:folylpolyglutamate synthase/dihydropteroate synthase/dihydropteroate synthase